MAGQRPKRKRSYEQKHPAVNLTMWDLHGKELSARVVDDIVDRTNEIAKEYGLLLHYITE